jgi:hypothetical protein
MNNVIALTESDLGAEVLRGRIGAHAVPRENEDVTILLALQDRVPGAV